MNKTHREARAAQEIISSAHLSGARPKQINLTGSTTGQEVQERSVDNTVVLTIVSLKYTVPVEYSA